ncbi:MAG: hypothetical protein ABIG95_03105 [Candidatus Woesearchaeota archaeon]
MEKKCECGCKKWFSVLVLLLGFWFLLQDLGYISGWGISWWTVVFLLGGAKMMWHTWFTG